jgi:ABC-type multidrug transport system ATPase subunit
MHSKPTDLRVEKVTKVFGKNLAVDNVSFGVRTSEIFALLGPNGAAKSTIISMLRGDIKPSSPRTSIEIAGHSIMSDPVTARSNLGVWPQFDFADVHTVKETSYQKECTNSPELTWKPVSHMNRISRNWIPKLMAWE